MNNDSLCRLERERARMDGIDMETAVDPIALFRAWMKAAEASEPNDASAVALATATRDGMPSVRMVLMKRADQQGFRFYTNAESQKGVELAENPRAAMCFHWKSLLRQVRVSASMYLPLESVTVVGATTNVAVLLNCAPATVAIRSRRAAARINAINCTFGAGFGSAQSPFLLASTVLASLRRF